MSSLTSVRCEFNECEISIIARVVTAAVDQLSAEEDANIVVLDALELPLAEMIEAIHRHGIEYVVVATHHGTLTLRFGLSTPVFDVDEALGESSDMIQAFFELYAEDEPAAIQLTGSLV